MEGADRCDRAAAADPLVGKPAFRCVRCNEHRIGVSMVTSLGRICEPCNLFVSVQFHPEERAMRGFRIAGAIALAIASLSVVRPAVGQDLGLVAAAVEAEACKTPAELPPCPQPQLDNFVETAKPPVCVDGKCTPAQCANGECRSGDACPCDSCDCTAASCCSQASEHSVVTHRGHVFNGDARFMERGPGRRLCGRVFGRMRSFIVEGGPIRRALKSRRGH